MLEQKISDLRKKNGWSQEELSEKMNVSRQSVSKWESGQATPDLDKILQLCDIFGVTSDYLLKDSVEDDAPATPCARIISQQFAQDFIEKRKKSAITIAVGVLLCILSPICLLILTVGGDTGALPFSAEAGAGIGISTLLLLVIFAVALFVTTGLQTKQFEFLNTQPIKLDRDALNFVNEVKQQYNQKYIIYNVFGVCLCIASAIPLIATACITENDWYVIFALAVLLILVAIGVMLLIIAGVNNSAVNMLLQEGEYTAENKQKNERNEKIAAVYFPFAAAIYLAYSFITNDWAKSWIIWPIAGVLFVVITEVVSAISKRKN